MADTENIPLAEFDPDRKGIIEPSFPWTDIKPPEYCVLPIYKALINTLETDNKLRRIGTFGTIWNTFEPFTVEFQGKSVLVMYPGMGTFFAAYMMERLVAWGCRKFVACGACGVLKPELKSGQVIIPSSALRDEGTSYHYLPPSRTVEMNPEVVKKLEKVLQKYHVKYEIGRTWTLDAPFRETREKIARRKAEGCITAEDECSAFMAVAKFREVLFGQYLTASDDISGEKWDTNVAHGRSVQEKLFWLSVEACLSL